MSHSFSLSIWRLDVARMGSVCSVGVEERMDTNYLLLNMSGLAV
jgi:hypothetical protein